MSENRSVDIAEEALSTGPGGYVVKSDAAAELLPAVKTVLEGKRFLSASLAELCSRRPSESLPTARNRKDHGDEEENRSVQCRMCDMQGNNRDGQADSWFVP